MLQTHAKTSPSDRLVIFFGVKYSCIKYASSGCYLGCDLGVAVMNLVLVDQL